MKTCLSTLLACLCVVGVAVGADKPEKKKAPVNTVCPISGKPVAADAPTAMFDHKVVGFCCPNCPAAFAKLSDEAKGTKLDAAAEKGEAVNVMCPIMGENKVTEKGGFVIFEHQKVGFCCEGCDKKWAKLTDEEKKAKLKEAKKPAKKKK